MIMAKSYENVQKENTNKRFDCQFDICNVDTAIKEPENVSSQQEQNKVHVDLFGLFELHVCDPSILKYYCVDEYINVLDDGGMSGNRAKEN